jgi:hypothetical protein
MFEATLIFMNVRQRSRLEVTFRANLVVSCIFARKGGFFFHLAID